MADRPADQTGTHAESATTVEPGASDQTGGSIASNASGEYPRLIEEHHLLGPDGEDQIEATDEWGRRWYHLRPEPRGRYDLVGFNYTWWLIWILIVVLIFFPWGPGWGY